MSRKANRTPRKKSKSNRRSKGKKRNSKKRRSSKRPAMKGGAVDNAAFVEFMMNSPPYLTYYGREGCPWCVKFEENWARLVADTAVTNHVALNKIITYPAMSYVPDMDIKGFPTLVLNHPASIGRVTFAGNRQNYDEIVDWLALHNVLNA